MRWRDVRWPERLIAIEGLDLARRVRSRVLLAVAWVAVFLLTLATTVVVTARDSCHVSADAAGWALFGSSVIGFAALWFWLGARWALRGPR